MNEQEGKTLYQLYIITMMMKMNRIFFYVCMTVKNRAYVHMKTTGNVL